ncbi:hypothetical protein [Azospirillum sp. sgz301742]
MSPTLADFAVLASIGVCALAIGLYVRAVIGFERALDELTASSPALAARRTSP